jgi:hypothetical protein
MEQFLESFGQTLQILKVDLLCLILCNQCKSFQACLSSQLIGKPIVKDINDPLNLSLLENLMRDCNKLGHCHDTILLNLLVNILLLEFVEDSLENLTSHRLELWVETS